MAAGWICADVPPCPNAEQPGHASASTISHPKHRDAFNRPCANIQVVWSQFVSSCCFLLTSTANKCLHYGPPSPFSSGSVRLLRWLTALLVQPQRNATERFWSSPSFRPWPGNGILLATAQYTSVASGTSAQAIWGSNPGENMGKLKLLQEPLASTGNIGKLQNGSATICTFYLRSPQTWASDESKQHTNSLHL